MIFYGRRNPFNLGPYIQRVVIGSLSSGGRGARKCKNFRVDSDLRKIHINGNNGSNGNNINHGNHGNNTNNKQICINLVITLIMAIEPTALETLSLRVTKTRAVGPETEGLRTSY